MVNNFIQKVSSLHRIFGFLTNGMKFFLLHFSLYTPNFFATILEGISIVSLIPLIQSLQIYSRKSWDLSFLMNT